VGTITYIIIGLVMAAVMAGLVYYSSVNSSVHTAQRVTRGSTESKRGFETGGVGESAWKQRQQQQQQQQQRPQQQEQQRPQQQEQQARRQVRYLFRRGLIGFCWNDVVTKLALDPKPYTLNDVVTKLALDPKPSILNHLQSRRHLRSTRAGSPTTTMTTITTRAEALSTTLIRTRLCSQGAVMTVRVARQRSRWSKNQTTRVSTQRRGRSW